MRFAPLMATLVPPVPVAGLKLVIRGATVKLVALVAVPAGVVTLSGPLVAFAGTLVVICALESTWNVAVTPLNLTEVAPVSAVPLSVTAAPTVPWPGVKLAMVGLTVKFPTLVAVPAGVVTAIFPLVAPAGTVAVILVAVTTLKLAGVPLKVTEVVPVKFAPLMVTLAPITPVDGEKLVMRGATVKLVALVAVPLGAATLIAPVVAVAGTAVVI